VVRPELLEILVCPASRAPMVFFGEEPGGAFLWCPRSGLRYRIEDDVPVLLVEEATKVTAAEAARLAARAAELGLSVPA
jgi:uncharacterized protein YbaR (Trm112 family)